MAQNLLGKVIVSDINGETVAGRIVETEAYRATDDKGSHAYPDKRTKRTAHQFDPGGNSYIYLCYGIHHLFNVITGPINQGHVILVRAVELTLGYDIARSRRGIKGAQYNLTNGPGKWTQAFGITTELNKTALFSANCPIRIYDAETIVPESIITGPRVGIAYAEECAHWPWRYRIKDNKWTSKPDEVSY
jgi:DNA-3-methyladenine glycosylase